MQLTTDRLILRPFEESDLDALAAINADPQVMRFYPGPYSRSETAQMIARCKMRWSEDGYAFSAAVLKDSHRLIGLCGLSLFRADLRFAPMPEIGWRFDPTVWRQGFASEAARAWLDFGFRHLALPEIVSFTATVNTPSQGVMQKIGMLRWPNYDFEMPSIAQGHVLRSHVVYRLTREVFLQV